MSKIMWYEFGFWVLTGLLSGITKLTGISIDPTSLLLWTANAINAANPNKHIAGSVASSLSILSLGITIVSVVIALGVTYKAFEKYKYGALVMAALGFFSFFLLIAVKAPWAVWIGVACLLIGAAICTYVEGDVPRDFVSKYS